MPFRALDAAAVPLAPGPHPAASPYDRGVGAELGVRAFGLYQVELPPGGASVAHDHAGDGSEDVYAVLRGSGTVIVDGEPVAVRPGTFVFVTPESTRQVRAGPDGLVYLAVCAPPGG
jgi:quercetin dioxygenase-like cupin family protein